MSLKLLLLLGLLLPATSLAQAGSGGAGPASSNAPYANMPAIAPIGVRIPRYAEVPAAARGPALAPGKAYRLEEFGKGLFMVTDNAIQSMFLVYETGVVVIDAPQAYASHLREAIAEVTNKPVTHLIYSHSHADHIGGTRAFGGAPVIIAQEETKRLLLRDHDPERPIPTVTFKDQYTLRVGSQVLELSYHGDGHEPGNIFIHAPAQRTLMVIDVVFPGWLPWRRFAVAHEVLGVFAQVEEISKLDFDHFVGGHVARAGTKADVATQLAYMNDIRDAAGTALKSTQVGEGMAQADLTNPWAVYDNFIDRVVVQCVNTMTPKWGQKLAGFDVFIWDQCYTMEQTLRID